MQIKSNVSLSTPLNPFQVTGLFLYFLKASEKKRFSDVFRGYKKRGVTLNWLTDLCL